jgi:hypothetical protein
VAGGIAGLGALAGWFTTYVLDGQAVQKGVHDILSDNYGLKVEDVRCPDAPAMEPGNAFTCTARIDGQDVQVQVRVVSEQGQYKVANPAG